MFRLDLHQLDLGLDLDINGSARGPRHEANPWNELNQSARGAPRDPPNLLVDRRADSSNSAGAHDALSSLERDALAETLPLSECEHAVNSPRSMPCISLSRSHSDSDASSRAASPSGPRYEDSAASPMFTRASGTWPSGASSNELPSPQEPRAASYHCPSSLSRWDEFLSQVLAWVRAMTARHDLGTTVRTDRELHEAFRSGVVLCGLVNRIQPGSIIRIELKSAPFHMRENIVRFLAAAKSIGVPANELFDPADLFDGTGMRQVLICIYALGCASHNVPAFAGPRLGKSVTHVEGAHKKSQHGFEDEGARLCGPASCAQAYGAGQIAESSLPFGAVRLLPRIAEADRIYC